MQVIPILKRIFALLKVGISQVVIASNRSALALIGPYDSYEEAVQNSDGYDSQVILDKVHKAVVDVLEGNFAYERDGTAFANQPSINHLRRLLTAHLKDNDLVVDFGGGLGGTLVNNRDLFGSLNCYVVAEQSNFVEAGCDLSQKYGLQIQFIDSLCQLTANPDIIILSSVLQYIPNAEQVLQQVSKLLPRVVIIDRMAFAPNNASQKWWIQSEPTYYDIPVGYPIRPLSVNYILNSLQQYFVVEKWSNPFDPETPPHGGLLLCLTV